MLNWIKNLAPTARASQTVPYCDTERAVRDWNALLKGQLKSPTIPNFLADISGPVKGGGKPSEKHGACAIHSGQQFLS